MLFAKVSKEFGNGNKGEKQHRVVEVSIITTMFCVSQTRGKKSIAQLTDDELPKRVLTSTWTATLKVRTLDNI